MTPRSASAGGETESFDFAQDDTCGWVVGREQEYWEEIPAVVITA